MSSCPWTSTWEITTTSRPMHQMWAQPKKDSYESQTRRQSLYTALQTLSQSQNCFLNLLSMASDYAQLLLEPWIVQSLDSGRVLEGRCGWRPVPSDRIHEEENVRPEPLGLGRRRRRLSLWLFLSFFRVFSKFLSPICFTVSSFISFSLLQSRYLLDLKGII